MPYSCINGVLVLLHLNIHLNVQLTKKNLCILSPACFQITTFIPIIDANNPCSTNISFAVAGTGAVPNDFTWNVYWIGSNGERNYINNIHNQTQTSQQLGYFTIRDPNQQITISVQPGVCNGISQPISNFTFSLANFLGNPGSVFISGPTQVPFGGTSSFVMNGSCLLNPANHYSWQDPSAGHIVSGGNTQVASIQFTTHTCYSYNGYITSCFPSYVRATSTNSCFSQMQSGNAWSVTVP